MEELFGPIGIMHNPNHRKAVRLSLENQLMHLRNRRSQKAIERIGAVKEGVLRNHMILPDGHIRHSVF